ncbi:MAG: hypothetical protein HQM08_19975 [Candidatus Riflebacteria bacterium]|nr:hypothetical protein [Candidatus Riflebacteria bacterium]
MKRKRIQLLSLSFVLFVLVSGVSQASPFNEDANVTIDHNPADQVQSKEQGNPAINEKDSQTASSTLWQKLSNAVLGPDPLDQVVELANSTKDKTIRNQVLLKAGNLVKTPQDILRLAKICDDSAMKDTLLQEGINKLVKDHLLSSKYLSVQDILSIAREASNNSVHDRILGDGDTLIKSADELVALANAGSDEKAHESILQNGTILFTAGKSMVTIANAAHDPNLKDSILRSASEGNIPLDDFIILAKDADNTATRDFILEKGATKASTLAEVVKLSEAATSDDVKKAIFELSSKKVKQ